MRKLIDAILWIFLIPGDLIVKWFGVKSDQTQELARMLANSLFWIFVAIIGLWFWTSTFAIYQ